MFIWFMTLLAKWVIVLIPIYLLATDKRLDNRCTEKWALLIFVISLIFGWLSEILLIQSEQESAFAISTFSTLLILAAWALSAWGTYFYFIYRVSGTKDCKKMSEL